MKQTFTTLLQTLNVLLSSAITRGDRMSAEMYSEQLAKLWVREMFEARDAKTRAGSKAEVVRYG